MLYWSKFVTLRKEGYSEGKKSEKLKFSRTAIYNVIARFGKSGSFSDLNRADRTKVNSRRDDHVMERMLVYASHFTGKSSICFFALKYTTATKLPLREEFGLKAY